MAPVLANVITNALWNFLAWLIDVFVSWGSDFIGVDLPNYDLPGKLAFAKEAAQAFNQVVPINAIFSILFSGLVAKAAIRALRWVFAFIPTLGG